MTSPPPKCKIENMTFPILRNVVPAKTYGCVYEWWQPNNRKQQNNEREKDSSLVKVANAVVLSLRYFVYFPKNCKSSDHLHHSLASVHHKIDTPY